LDLIGAPVHDRNRAIGTDVRGGISLSQRRGDTTEKVELLPALSEGAEERDLADVTVSRTIENGVIAI
jgi:hypothetical protein